MAIKVTKSQEDKRIDALQGKGNGGGVGENVGQHNERFNGYTAADGCTITGGDYNHAEGYKSTLNGCYRTHVGGGENTVSGCQDTIVSGNGNTVYASNGSVVEGYNNTVSPYSGSSAICNLVVAQNSEVRGNSNKVTGVGNHLLSSDMNEVSGTGHTLTGTHKNIVGGVGHTLTGGHDNIVGGSQNTVTGVQSIVGGNDNTVSAASAGCVGGNHNIAVDGCFAAGYGATTTGAGTNPRFLIGNGSGTSLYIQANGDVFGGQYHTMGADYAELFEWSDGNPDNEDRRGMLVALDGDKIVPANGNEFLGVISAKPSVVGNSAALHWQDKYKRDVFGCTIRDKDGEPVLNPEYDPEKQYIPREQRPEWAAVGIVGKLIIVDNGSCKPNSYVSARNGIGTASLSPTNIRVLRRIDDTHVEVFIK